MIISTVVAQTVGAGEFDITLTIESDADAKAIMAATPNAWFTVTGKTTYLYEMNPVHLTPNTYRARLQTKLPGVLSRGMVLSVNV